MKKVLRFKYIALLFLLTQIITSCATKGKASLYSELAIPPQNVKAKTIAIMPNRYPLVLQNAEEWRVKNYESIKRILVRNGFNVVDYNTANQLFQESGLPMEDTKSSRDKYAELAQKLNADLLIFPYYGTSFSTTGFTNSYIAVTTLQLYSVAHNDFCARIDMEGTHKIQTWPSQVLPLVAIGLSYALVALEALNPQETSIFTYVGPATSVVYNIFVGIGGKKGHVKAFKKGLDQGMDLFLSRFTPASGGTINNGNNTASKYSKYSIEELETLKKAAVGNSDFKTAGEIKEEIDKRKK